MAKTTITRLLPPREIREITAARRAWIAETLAAQLAAGLDARVVGTGSYQCVTTRPAKVAIAKDEARGLCQCCGREYVCNTGKIPHHGYSRPLPGSGIQTESCRGAQHPTLEQSCDTAFYFASECTTRAQTLRDRLSADYDLTADARAVIAADIVRYSDEAKRLQAIVDRWHAGEYRGTDRTVRVLA